MARRWPRLAAAAGVLLGSAVLVAPGAAARASKPTHVAIVIGGQGVRCVSAGGSGDDILNSVADVHYRSDGVIVQINGVPSSGKADDTHYWSYWHDTGTGWRYSAVGASGYQPAPGTVEGWSYDNGAADPPPPPAASYASICGASDPHPRPHPAPRTTHTSARRTPTKNASRHAGPGTARHAATSPAAAATPPSRATSHHASTAHSRTVAPAPSTDGAASSSGNTGLPTLHSTPAAKHTSGSATPTLVGGGLATMIAGAAGWTLLRRRQAGDGGAPGT